MKNDFRKYAVGHLGMDGLTFDEMMKAQAQYLNPYILEERQLNVTQMDVFSRLMMDRIIFLGTQIDDYTANTLQAQLLYLDSVDSGKDISIYINSPGGSVTAGLGIYDTMQFISSDVATICTGMAASMAAVLLVAGTEGKRSALPHSRVMIHQPLGGVQGQASDIEIEEKKKALTDMQTENIKKQADAKGYELEKTLAPYKNLDWHILMAMNNNGLSAADNLGLAFRELAEKSEKIGNLNITPDLLKTLIDRDEN